MTLFPALLILTVMTAAHAAKPEVEWKPLSIGGMQEIGQLQKGIWKDIGEPFTDEWIDNFGVFFKQQAIVEERLHITVGLGGIFQFPKPEVPQAEFGGSQYKAFFLGPSIAEGVYHFGNPQEPVFKLGMGMFPYKYNPEAQNLGEYLFRSGPYPTYITTGGFSLINNSSAFLQGFKAQLKLGNLKLDGLLVTETNMPPLYDWSLAGVAEYSVGDGLLNIGAGVNFKRLIQVRPSRTTPQSVENSYFQKNGAWFPGSTDEYQGKAGFHNRLVRENVDRAIISLTGANPNHPALPFLADPNPASLDSAYNLAADVPGAQPILQEARLNGAQAGTYTSIADSIQYWTTTDSVLDPVSGSMVAYAKPAMRHFSSEGILLMARGTVDLKKLFPWKGFGPQDLKVFAEASLLGTKNYEVYYTRYAERMPVMLGINLPTFKLLDLLTLQVEYFDSPYANNFISLGNANATPFFPGGTSREFSENYYYDAADRDNYSWSVLLKKRILPGLDFYTQFARDHVRTVGTDWFFGSRLEPNEILHLSENWYWMAMMSWNL